MTREREDFARLLDGHGSGHGPEGSGRALEALGLARRELDGATAARPEFRDALRTRLLAVAAVQPEAQAPARTAPVPLLEALRARRRLAALSGALAGVVALTGVGVATSRSGPGDLFYAAKRTAEDVRLGVASGSRTEQGVRRLQLATTRLSELEALTATGRTTGLSASAAAADRPLAAGASRDEVRDLLDDMDDDVRDGSRLVLDAYRDHGDQASLVVLRDWSVEQAARLRALVPRLSQALQPRAEGSLSLVREVEGSAVRLIAAPAVAEAPVTGPEVAGSPSAEPGSPVEAEGAEGARDSGPGPEQSGPEQSGPEQSGPEQSGPEQSGPEQEDPGQPGTGPRPLSPIEEDGAPLPQPTTGDDAPLPRPSAVHPLPPLPTRSSTPSRDPLPLPTTVAPSGVLPTGDLSVPPPTRVPPTLLPPEPPPTTLPTRVPPTLLPPQPTLPALPALPTPPGPLREPVDELPDGPPDLR